MSERKHTPGPWKVIPPGHGHPTDCLCVQIGEDELYSTIEMLPADAHLVAVAPDMLAMCRQYLAYVDLEESPSKKFNAAMRAVVAKAEK